MMKMRIIFIFAVFFAINLVSVVTLNAEDISKLVNELKSNDALKQIQAYEKLSKLKDSKSVPLLIDMCHSKTTGYDLAYDLLIEIGEPAVRPSIKAMINEKENRSIFLTILRSIGKPAIIPLAEMLEKEAKEVKSISEEDPHWINFMDILMCLKDIGRPSVPYLEKFLKTCDNRKLSSSVKRTIDSIR